MNKQISEPDFIGGQGQLTKEEELALSAYFASKKIKAARRTGAIKPKTSASTRTKAGAV